MWRSLKMITMIVWFLLRFHFHDCQEISLKGGKIEKDLKKKTEFNLRKSAHHHRHRVHIKHSNITKSGIHFGIDFPSFAFDYSEYFVNAAITPSSYEKKEYSLTMALLGHQTIYEDYPFEAINTDEKTLSMWSQVIKIWKKESHSHDQPRLAHKRKYVCVFTSISNPKLSYQSSVSWLEGINFPRNETSNLNRNFEMIRCKIKPLSLQNVKTGPSNYHLPQSMNYSASFYVDIVETGKVANKSRDSSPNIILSFLVTLPAERTFTHTGYPYHPDHHFYDPSLFNTTFRTDSLQKVGNLTSHSSKSKIHVCVSNVRPMQSPRPLVGIPSVLEFIEHLLLLGVHHISLGLMITSDSVLMKKYEYFFKRYIEAKQLTLISTSLPPYQDFAGLSGMQLNDTFSSIFLYNQCLLQAQSTDDVAYLLFMKANQFLAFPSLQLTQDTLCQSLVRREHDSPNKHSPHASFKIVSSSTTLAHSSYPSSLAKPEKGNKFAFADPNHVLTKPDGNSPRRKLAEGMNYCSFVFIETVYGISDSPDIGMPFGPSDYYLFKDYYGKGSSVFSLHTPDSRVIAVNPVKTRAIDVLPNGRILPLCSTSSKTHASHPTTASESDRNSNKFIAFIYDEQFPASSIPLSKDKAEQMLTYHKNLFQTIEQQRSQHHPDLKTIQQIQSTIQTFQKTILPQLQADGTLPLKEIILDRKIIQPPFWQFCSTNHLSDIYERIFK